MGYVYFMSDKNNKVLYVGVTNNLKRRVWEHKNRIDRKSFTAKYCCYKLVYYECADSIKVAIAREKQLKDWKRVWKNELVDEKNPMWSDLAENWYESGDMGDVR